MEKICIVKLRKSLPEHHPASPGGYADRLRPLPEGAAPGRPAEPGGPAAQAQPARPHLTGMATRAAGQAVSGPFNAVVSLPLTDDQVRMLEAHPPMAALLAPPTPAADDPPAQHEAVVIRLELPAPSPLRLLKTAEVLCMLRISRKCLNRAVREGQLRSYRIGQQRRLRRFRLEDVLSYLENGREGAAGEPPSIEAESPSPGREA